MKSRLLVFTAFILLVACKNPIYNAIISDAYARGNSISSKAISMFGFTTQSVSGVVSEATHTIVVTVPYGTDVSALVPTISITGASISPASGVARNFTSPVVYTVSAVDSSMQAYTVQVTVASSYAKAITAFTFASPAAIGSVSESAHTIALTVPYSTDVTSLVPTITITGASVSPASGIAQNFTNPVTYNVTAADSTTQSYIVTVRSLPARPRQFQPSI